MRKEIEEQIQKAEMVLIGIGEECTPELPDFDGDVLEPYRKSQYYAGLPEDHEILRAYRRLRELVGDRPHFVVTMNTDDLIYRAGFEPEQIVAPCGSMGKLQCSEHILDAATIRQQVLAAAEHSEGESAEAILTRLAVCPECGEPLVFHTIEQEGYLERGYLPQWERYRKWLSCTLNRTLCILELGVGFRYPQVIRWPFEKTAFYNKKAALVRVHSKFWQIGEELEGKAVAVAELPTVALL